MTDNGPVLGIDPGLNTTGYAVLQWAATGPTLCEAGVVRRPCQEVAGQPPGRDP